MAKQTEIVLTSRITMIFDGHEEVPENRVEELKRHFADIIKSYMECDDVVVTDFQTFLHGDVENENEGDI